MTKRTTGRLLSEREAAEYIGVFSYRTLRRYRYEGAGPRYVQFGDAKNARVAYRVEDLEEWIEELARESVSA